MIKFLHVKKLKDMKDITIKKTQLIKTAFIN